MELGGRQTRLDEMENQRPRVGQTLLVRISLVIGMLSSMLLVHMSLHLAPLSTSDNNSRELFSSNTVSALFTSSSLISVKVEHVKTKNKSPNVVYTGIFTPRVSTEPQSLHISYDGVFVNNLTQDEFHIKDDKVAFKNSESTGCLDESDIPPLDSLSSLILSKHFLEHLEPAREDLLATDVEFVAKCSTNLWYSIVFAGEEYAFCVMDHTVYVISDDIKASIEFFESAPPTTTSKTTLPIDLQCPTSAALTTSDASTSSNNTRRLSSQCDTCYQEKKPCVFFHGAGTKVNETKLLSSYEAYWGDTLLDDNIPCSCSSVSYARFDTFNNKWTSSTLQHQFCDALNSFKDTEDLIVITHSMASLVLSLAIDSGKCELSSNTKWISSQAPMAGSAVSNALEKLCNSSNRLTNAALERLSVCPASSSFPFYAQGTELASSLDSKYEAAQSVFQERVDAVMCGTSSYGLTSGDSARYAAISSYVDTNEENDGIVNLSSCMGGLDSSMFHPSFTSRFYKASINHADGAFRNGDGWWGSHRKPVKWLKCLF